MILQSRILRPLAGLALLLCLVFRAGGAELPPPEVFMHPATADALVTLIGPNAAGLKSAAALHGHFAQRKLLAELPQPLLSSGDFLVARGLGVEWRTLKPFDSAVVLTPSALLQRGADGSTQSIPADQQPGLRAVGQVFDALFTLDLAKLDQTFVLYGEPKAGGGWTLGLVPRDAAFASRIARIVIDGSAQPAHIVMFEGRGDRTEIDFSGVVASRELAEAERKRFGP